MTQKGVLLAFLAAGISGFSVYLNKFAVTGINPLTFTATKNFGVGLLLVCLLIITSKWKKIKVLNAGEITKLILIGIIGGSLPFYLFFTGLAQTSAINAAIIQKTMVVWVAMLAIPLLKERLTILQIAAIALLFYANIFVGGFKKFTFSNGEIMILAATILWAGENILAKKALKTIDVDVVTVARMGFGSLILLAFSGGLHPVTASQLRGIMLTAVILFAYVSVWYRALKFAPATLVSGILVSATLVTNFLSASIVSQQNILMLVATGLLLSELLWSKRKDFFALLALKP